MLRNCKIVNTVLGPAASHGQGVFTFNLELDFGDQRVLFGFVSLDSQENDKRVPTQYGMDVIMEIIKVAGVNSWEELKGSIVRAYIDDITSQVVGIVNILDDNLFILPGLLFQQKYAPPAPEITQEVQDVLDQAQPPEF